MSGKPPIVVVVCVGGAIECIVGPAAAVGNGTAAANVGTVATGNGAAGANVG